MPFPKTPTPQRDMYGGAVSAWGFHAPTTDFSQSLNKAANDFEDIATRHEQANERARRARTQVSEARIATSGNSIVTDLTKLKGTAAFDADPVEQAKERLAEIKGAFITADLDRKTYEDLEGYFAQIESRVVSSINQHLADQEPEALKEAQELKYGEVTSRANLTKVGDFASIVATADEFVADMSKLHGPRMSEEQKALLSQTTQRDLMYGAVSKWFTENPVEAADVWVRDKDTLAKILTQKQYDSLAGVYAEAAKKNVSTKAMAEARALTGGDWVKTAALVISPEFLEKHKGLEFSAAYELHSQALAIVGHKRQMEDQARTINDRTFMSNFQKACMSDSGTLDAEKALGLLSQAVDKGAASPQIIEHLYALVKSGRDDVDPAKANALYWKISSGEVKSLDTLLPEMAGGGLGVSPAHYMTVIDKVQEDQKAGTPNYMALALASYDDAKYADTKYPDVYWRNDPLLKSQFAEEVIARAITDNKLKSRSELLPTDPRLVDAAQKVLSEPRWEDKGEREARTTAYTTTKTSANLFKVSNDYIDSVLRTEQQEAKADDRDPRLTPELAAEAQNKIALAGPQLFGGIPKSDKAYLELAKNLMKRVNWDEDTLAEVGEGEAGRAGTMFGGQKNGFMVEYIQMLEMNPEKIPGDTPDLKLKYMCKLYGINPKNVNPVNLRAYMGVLK